MTGLEQSRQLVTEIPGPASLELNKRRVAAVSRGVGITLSVYVARAGGGIIEDAKVGELIDVRGEEQKDGKLKIWAADKNSVLCGEMDLEFAQGQQT